MELELRVILQISPDAMDAEFTTEQLQNAATQAVSNALEYAENNGFAHDLAYQTSIGIVAVAPIPIPIRTGLLTVRLEHDQCADCNPAADDCQWTVYSFSSRHASYKSPAALGLSGSLDPNSGLPAIEDEQLAEKVEKGLAFFLSYFEHGNCLWFRHGSSAPAGVEFRWDGTRVAGLLVWHHEEDAIGGKTWAERAEDADSFLETYTAWCNGEGYYYCIEDEDGDVIDSCGGFLGDPKYMLGEMASMLAGRKFEVQGDAAYLEADLRAAVAAKEKEKSDAVA